MPTGTHFSSSTGHLSFPSWNMVVRFTPLLQRPACVFSIPGTTPESAWRRVLSDLLQCLASLSKQASCLLICVVIRSCSVVGSGYNAFLSLSTVSWSYRILVRPLLLLVLISPNILGFGLSVMSTLSVPSVLICPYRLPGVGYRQFPGVSGCRY